VTPDNGPVSQGVQGKPESFINTLEAGPTLTHSSLTPDTVNHDSFKSSCKDRLCIIDKNIGNWLYNHFADTETFSNVTCLYVL